VKKPSVGSDADHGMGVMAARSIDEKQNPMANYYPLLANIIAALENSSAELRRRLYENARTGFLEQMRRRDPPLADAHITQEQIAFEDAIRKVEAEQMGRATGLNANPRPE
jgi:hypothetical protein